MKKRPAVASEPAASRGTSQPATHARDRLVHAPATKRAKLGEGDLSRLRGRQASTNEELRQADAERAIPEVDQQDTNAMGSSVGLGWPVSFEARDVAHYEDDPGVTAECVLSAVVRAECYQAVQTGQIRSVVRI